MAVVHCSFTPQRCLQRSMVPVLHWTESLGKGKSGNIMQHNLEINTTFEQRFSVSSRWEDVQFIQPLTAMQSPR